MKCRICGRRTTIKSRTYNLPLCEEHFVEFFEKRVKKAINSFHMFDKNSRILVAVSGGKDSLTAWEVLRNLGYEVDGLHVRLGIGDYTKLSYEKSFEFAKKRNLRLIVVDLKDYLGMDLPDLPKNLRRRICGICGMAKRYITNRVAIELSYDVLVTGHNLDDEVSVLLGNMLHWNMEYIHRQSPVLRKTHEKFVKKVKPLVFVGNDDVDMYAKLKGVDFVEENCPFSKGATSKVYSEIFRILDEKQPGIKPIFLMGFYREKARFKDGDVKLNSCKICGYPTTDEICSFCKLKIKLNDDEKN